MNIVGLRSDSHAIKLLIADHREVDGLFKAVESASNANEKASLVTEICEALTVHAELEEKLFYPASRQILESGDQDLVDEAFVEHASLKGLILQLDGKRPSDPLFDAYVTVLKEYVQHHVKEEEAEYFPKVQRSTLDLEALGVQMLELKAALMKRQKAKSVHGTVSANLIASKPLETRASVMRKAA
ncbi:hemerythrin domain-containing protein [Hydrocarboniphaga effusa]|uniref:hemerythrin domain-containing protein n=1 Tax=Hydrocarboniphaga effusa TaxID=243629 RepID=UPI0035B19BC6